MPKWFRDGYTYTAEINGHACVVERRERSGWVPYIDGRAISPRDTLRDAKDDASARAEVA